METETWNRLMFLFRFVFCTSMLGIFFSTLHHFPFCFALGTFPPSPPTFHKLITNVEMVPMFAIVQLVLGDN